MCTLQFSSPSLKDDGKWYWYYNTGLQAQSGWSTHIDGASRGVTNTLFDIVIYRSKDSTLPDFSKEDGPGGEIFFDVCHSFVLGINGNDSVYYLTLAKLARGRWHCCLVCNRVLQVWRVLCLWYLPLCKHSF